MPTKRTAYLRALSGPAAGEEFPLQRDMVSLGRGPENDIDVPDSDLAKLQAKIRRADDRWTLFNCTPETRIFVREIPVDRCHLEPGVPVRIGSAMYELVLREPDDDTDHTDGAGAKSVPKSSVPAVRSAARDFFQPAASGTESKTSAFTSGSVFKPGKATISPVPPPPTDTEDEALPSGLVLPVEEKMQAPSGLSALATAGNLAYTVFVVVVVLGGALLVHWLGRRPPPPPVQHILIQEGGNGSIVSVWPTFYDQIGKRNDEAWKQVVEMKAVEPPAMVELLGKNQGSAEVPLFSNGKHALTLHVTVRGREDRKTVLRPDRSMDELLVQAKQLIERGRHLQRDHPYHAIEDCFRPAAEFLEKLNNEKAQSLDIEAKSLLREAEGELDGRLKDYEQQFWQAYYLRDYSQSLRQLRLVLEWVPDASDKRHQRAAILANVIRQQAGTQSDQR